MNKIMLVGRVGSDIDKKEKFSKFSLATTEKWKDKETGENKESTQWHSCIVNGKLKSSYVDSFLNKGDLVSVEGKMTYSSVTGDDNVIKNYANVQVVGIDKLANNKAED
jgi:single-strand DNA-binding protein